MSQNEGRQHTCSIVWRVQRWGSRGQKHLGATCCGVSSRCVVLLSAPLAGSDWLQAASHRPVLAPAVSVSARAITSSAPGGYREYLCNTPAAPPGNYRGINTSLDARGAGRATSRAHRPPLERDADGKALTSLPLCCLPYCHPHPPSSHQPPPGYTGCTNPAAHHVPCLLASRHALPTPICVVSSLATSTTTAYPG
jgi:hypothetical protein